MNDSSIDLEMQSSTHPPPTATGSDEEEDQQCWRDVEAETGHSSYKSFLETLPVTGPQYRDLLGMIGMDVYGDQFGEVHVFNILEDGGMSIGMKVQGLNADRVIPTSDGNSVSDKHKCTQLLRNLRSPPENTPSRIVVWSLPRGLHSGLVDAIGLGLKIQPAVFATLVSKFYQGHSGYIKSSRRRLGPDYIIIGNSIATVARNYIPNKRVPPVLFVVKLHHIEIDLPRLPSDFDEDYDDIIKEVLTSEIYGSITLCHAAHRASNMRPLEDLAANSSGYLGRGHLDGLSNHVYLNLLSKNVQRGAGVDAQSDGPLLNAILSLLHLQVLYLHAQCEITQEALLMAQRETTQEALLMAQGEQRYYKSLDKWRFELRRKLEDLEESRARFVKFAYLQNAPKWLEEQPWMSQEEEITEAVNKARAQEAEARDYMQLQIGNLSIEESRKSIQLSSQQMSEAKRGTSPKHPKLLIAC